jgi:hypothetical protein
MPGTANDLPVGVAEPEDLPVVERSRPAGHA